MSDTLQWQEIRTSEEARDKAAETVDNTATARQWWQQGRDYADRALSAALDGSDGSAGSFWARLDATWAGAGDAFPDGVKPERWDSLAEVWRSAAATTGAALDAEEAQSLKAIVSGGLKGSVEDAKGAAGVTAGIIEKAATFANAHPGLTVLGVVGVVLLFKTAPLVLARLVTR